jgi:tetratricopeptide (TPR) repeat protein
MNAWLAVFLAVSPLSATTPAESALAQAQALVSREPGQSAGYNALALAAARRGVETADARFYQMADEALRQSFAAEADNFEGRKSEVCLLLARHEYAQAAESAARLNRQVPDDVAVYGCLVDAHAGLGNYPEAISAAQWMLKLRAGNPPGLERAGRLREVSGDLAGALEATGMAYDATPASDIESRARLLTRMAHLNLAAGDPAESERFAHTALGLISGNSAALGALGEVRMVQKRYDEAAGLFRRQHDAAPRPQELFALAKALAAAGRSGEAVEIFAAFEREASAVSGQADNANQELVAYYLDQAKAPLKALAVARLEIARRHDIFTLDCFARALNATGDSTAARAQMAKALAVGTADPEILRHGREIGVGPSVAAAR